ncbi:hypothetical protein Focb16_v002109 [Fusarium oxysporum f. sp. cubense]|uniref:Uncharacterized protein n=1 Tax=Fusarium oxysporum f. sp. cubense TaxID=61366 RepID=A0A559L5N8_FUSOC|nr:hypothetical protein Focb16_v002109 [Fusarium oxysporum f. sp. cubense]
MSLGRHETKSHQQHPERGQDNSGQPQEIRHISESSISNPIISPCEAMLEVDMHDANNRDENNKLLNISSHEIRDNRDSFTTDEDAIGTNYALHRKNNFLSWWQEIAWCVFATGLLAVLVGLLKTYDKKPGPEWFVSLNAVVAAIATICRASMVIPVSEGLSQLKWNAFARSQRPLNDLKIFDQASRGPFGSLLLLSKTKGRLLGVSTIAAIILISGLATSSLTQATISFGPPLRRLSENAVASKASSIDTDNWHKLKDQLSNSAFQAYFISERQRKNLQLNPSCPSSCHWNKFRSIDICDVQRNVTDQLKLELLDPDNLGDFDKTQGVDDEEGVEYWRVKLGEDFQVDDINAYNWVCATDATNTDWARGLWGDDMDKFPVTTLTTQLFIYKKLSYPGYQPVRSYKGARSPYRAVAVTWYWCIKEYEIDISAGTTHIKAGETDYQVINGSEKLYESDRHFTLVDNQTLERFPVTLGNWALSSSWKIEPMGRANDAMAGQASHRIIGNATLVEDDPWDNIMTWKEDATSAMSAVVRTYKTDINNTVQGYAEINQPTIIIHWAWLSLLVAQILLMVVFVIYVILETAKLDVQVVKGSNIAELKAIGQENSIPELEYVLAGGIAESVDADLVGRLVKSDSGWSLKVNRRAVC